MYAAESQCGGLSTLSKDLGDFTLNSFCLGRELGNRFVDALVGLGQFCKDLEIEVGWSWGVIVVSLDKFVFGSESGVLLNNVTISILLLCADFLVVILGLL